MIKNKVLHFISRQISFYIQIKLFGIAKSFFCIQAVTQQVIVPRLCMCLAFYVRM